MRIAKQLPISEDVAAEPVLVHDIATSVIYEALYGTQLPTAEQIDATRALNPSYQVVRPAPTLVASDGEVIPFPHIEGEYVGPLLVVDWDAPEP